MQWDHEHLGHFCRDRWYSWSHGQGLLSRTSQRNSYIIYEAQCKWKCRTQCSIQIIENFKTLEYQIKHGFFWARSSVWLHWLLAGISSVKCFIGHLLTWSVEQLVLTRIDACSKHGFVHVPCAISVGTTILGLMTYWYDIWIQYSIQYCFWLRNPIIEKKMQQGAQDHIIHTVAVTLRIRCPGSTRMGFWRLSNTTSPGMAPFTSGAQSRRLC